MTKKPAVVAARNATSASTMGRETISKSRVCSKNDGGRKMFNAVSLILLLALMAVGAYSAKATIIGYGYDEVGNRVSRTILLYSNVPTTPGNPSDTSLTYTQKMAETSVRIYPNPTKGVLRIDLVGAEVPSTARIALYSISGQLLRQWDNLTGENVIDLSDRATGIYVLHIVLDEKRAGIWKIVKQ